MSKNKFKDYRDKREPGLFVTVGRQFLRSTTLATLSPYAAKLYLDLLAQYNGFNNGDLCAAWTVMQKRGWRSKATLYKALQELLQSDVVMLTRQGGRHKASLYALTQYAINDCDGKLDVAPTSHPPRTWLLHEPPPPLPTKRSVPRRAG